jgi:hypothetical protein
VRSAREFRYATGSFHLMPDQLIVGNRGWSSRGKERLPGAVAGTALIGEKVGIIVMHEIVAITLA